MTLAELGAQLREERASLGLTVEDVAAQLKIPSRILRSIEDGDVKDLPHTVYTRGFIKGYAVILGYPNEKITELLDGLEGFDEDFSPPKTVERQTLSGERPSTRTARKERRGGALKLLLKLCVLAAIIGGGYYYYLQTFGATGTDTAGTGTAGTDISRNTPAPESAAPAGPVTATPDAAGNSGPNNAGGNLEGSSSAVSPAAPDHTPAATPAGAPAGASADAAPAGIPGYNPPPLSATGQSMPTESPAASASTDQTSGQAGQTPAQTTSQAPGQTSEADPVGTSGFAPLPADAASGQAPNQTAGQTSSPAAADAARTPLPAGMHQIVLTASAACWVHANADGTETREFTLKAGETFAMPFKKSLVLKLGNAGGVQIKYDGVDMPSPGASGQVKTITFPPQE